MGELVRTVDKVPGLVSETLLSTSKFMSADYISIYTPKEVDIYDARITNTIVTKKVALKGW